MKYLSLFLALFSLGFMLLQIFLYIGTRTLLCALGLLLNILVMALSFRYVPAYSPGIRIGLEAVGLYMAVMIALVVLFVRMWLKDIDGSKGWLYRKQ